MSFSDHLSSIVCPSVRLSVCKLFTFSSSSPEQLRQFQPNLAQSILRWRGFKILQMKGHALSQSGDNWELIKINWQLLKIFFSRTAWPILTKLSTKYHWVKGIQVCSNEGPCPFPKGNNYKKAKIHWQNFIIFFSRTTGPISTKLGTKHPLMMGIQVCSNKGPRLFPRGDSTK